jgi:hypothetical protein
MPLPKIKYPIYELTLPSDKSTVKFRPFTVKEEKLLLIAQEGDDVVDRLNAVRQIVNNCCLNLSTDVGLLPAFDLGYIFLKMRSKSIGNILEPRYRDLEDEKIYDFIIDLDTIEVKFTEGHTNVIQLNDALGMVMQYPTIEMLDEVAKYEDQSESTVAMVKRCIAKIYDEERTYDAAEYTDAELTEFLESIPSKDFEKVIEFFSTMPTLFHELKYTNSVGTEKTITLQGIEDFFQ